MYGILFVEYAIYFTNMLNKKQPVHTPFGIMVIRLSFLHSMKFILSHYVGISIFFMEMLIFFYKHQQKADHKESTGNPDHSDSIAYGQISTNAGIR